MVERKVKYAEDKPKDCTYCYFWLGGRKGCRIDTCFYLEESEEDGADPDESCEGCPYGRDAPCIGYCLRKIMREMKVGR
ncbi:MAG: hypothetical protein LUC60_05595 [Lachnospiraceae bacterium]|nr:hypothetical protein [Lachnospiraceae bacterium]